MTAYEMLQARKAAQGLTLAAPASAPMPAPAPAAPAAPATATAPAPALPADPAVQRQMAKNLGADVPAICGKAILVNFSAPMPRNSKLDRKVTTDVKRQQGMGKQSGKWDKTVFPPKIYSACASVIGAARTWHYSETLDWPVDGQQLLPARNHEAYCAGMREWKLKADAARDEFLSRLPEMIEWARNEHNGSFDESLYHEEKIRRKFGWEITFMAIPISDHFMSGIRNLLGDSADKVDSMVKDAVADAQQSLWRRLLEPLQNMRQILTKKEAGDHTRVTESLLGNILQIAKQIPALDLGNDPALSQFAAEAEQAFAGFSSDDLSEDKSQRQQALAKAKEIIARMSGVMES